MRGIPSVITVFLLIPAAVSAVQWSTCGNVREQVCPITKLSISPDPALPGSSTRPTWEQPPPEQPVSPGRGPGRPLTVTALCNGHEETQSGTVRMPLSTPPSPRLHRPLLTNGRRSTCKCSSGPSRSTRR